MSGGAENGGPVEEQHPQQEEEEAFQGSPPYSRMVGGTEFSWCRAVTGGTGITVLALLFDHQRLLSSLSEKKPQQQQHSATVADQDECCCGSGGGGVVKRAVQAVVDELQRRHPRLRSRLVWIQGRPGLSVSDDPFVTVHCGCNEYSREEMAEKQGGSADEWLTMAVEAELQRNREWSNGCASNNNKVWAPMMAVRLLWRAERCLLIFRLHTAICDRASAATILTQLLQGLSSQSQSYDNPQPHDSPSLIAIDVRLVAIEDAIPPGKARKPFWAHGIDLLGYSLGSRRHSLLPFEHTPSDDVLLGDHHSTAADTCTPRKTYRPRSEIIRHTLSAEHTRKLLEACSEEGTSRLGALTAAGLKATAMLKQLGVRSEQYAVVTLLDCRSLFDPALPESTIGFYHSALVNTHSVNEGAGFWEVARRCSDAVAKAVSNRKHFTDMGDVNLLMCQAMQFPQLTPYASLRTSHLVLFHDTLQFPHALEHEDLRHRVGLLDSVGCSSVHGVGPSVAIFDSIQQGALHTTCVYPAPLHSRDQIGRLLDIMMDLLTSAAAQN